MTQLPLVFAHANGDRLTMWNRLMLMAGVLILPGCYNASPSDDKDAGSPPAASDTIVPADSTDSQAVTESDSSPPEDTDTGTADGTEETTTGATADATDLPNDTVSDTSFSPRDTASDTDDVADSGTEFDSDTETPSDTFPEGVCRDAPPEDEPLKVYFDVHRSSGEFYRLPFPTDLRRTGDGIDMSGHFSPVVTGGDDEPADLYLEMMGSDLDGFGTQSAVFFRFNHFPDESTLVADRFSPDQSIFLINLDKDSPGYGEHDEYRASANAEGNSYICDNWLGVYPADGIPLLPGTPYAVLVTTAVTDGEGTPVASDEALPAMLDPTTPSDDRLTDPWSVYAPLRQFLADIAALEPINTGRNVPLSRETIAGATVFTTGHPPRRLPGIRGAVRSEGPPEYENFTVDDTRDDYILYTGGVTTPFYQNGERPFMAPEDGGTIDYDETGMPRRVTQEAIPFALTVPTGGPPTRGWPVVIYAHGTGGSERTILGNELAERMAALGIATLGMQQVQHGDRRAPPGEEAAADTPGPDMLFYNYLNPRATRDNNHQAAAEIFQAVYMIETFDNQSGIEVGLDANRIVFFGHSQGSQGSFLGAAFEPHIQDIILSGSGGLLIESLLNRTEPIDIPALLSMLLGDDHIDRLHPLLNIVQADMESVDPVNFAPYVFRSPNPDLGLPARSVLLGAGFGDPEVPDVNQQALVKALDLHQWADEAIPLWDIARIPAVDGLPYQGSDGVTAVAARYALPEGQDAHFVMFDNENAVDQTDEFIRTLVSPEIDPPIFDAPP